MEGESSLEWVLDAFAAIGLALFCLVCMYGQLCSLTSIIVMLGQTKDLEMSAADVDTSYKTLSQLGSQIPNNRY